MPKDQNIPSKPLLKLWGFKYCPVEQEERFDKAMLNTYIIGHVNDAVNPDLEGIYTVMLSLRSSNKIFASMISGME